MDFSPVIGMVHEVKPPRQIPNQWRQIQGCEETEEAQ
jgi:hypothetical protein